MEIGWGARDLTAVYEPAASKSQSVIPNDSIQFNAIKFIVCLHRIWYAQGEASQRVFVAVAEPLAELHSANDYRKTVQKLIS